ncbi:riboflavin synthase [Paenibacillus segetis]|uniref:Riboflavin synthase n=1 Tax=Paenibacillus segetis TaxID=1325360 RepID=A0ABQ1YGS3_9BACL|nr:riboflavin synthase [Paenibacillus segetis]GGH24825.1 riboflavin synthase subunit alpha [Paenibacillus segetis]
MFTGLVEEVGRMNSVSRRGEAMELEISADLITDGLKLGDSISVNGVCLTATSFQRNKFTVDVMPQTYRNTNLKDLKPGSKVNLERAMLAGGRFGGHIVQGHVDGVGTITGSKRDYNAVMYEIAPSDPSLFKYIIPQGSITVDGISLTVVDVKARGFSISIIPHTLSETLFAYKNTGDTVNLECDVLGKYVDHLLRYGRAKSDDGSSKAQSASSSSMDMSFLVENGFV